MVLVASSATTPLISESPVRPKLYLSIRSPSVSASCVPLPSISALGILMPQLEGLARHAAICSSLAAGISLENARP